MMFWLRFALRSCLRRRRKTAVTLLGIAFGVGTLIVLGAIMVGVNDTMVENAVALSAGHVVVSQDSLAMTDASRGALAWAAYGGGVAAITHTLPRCRFPAVVESNKSALPFEIRLVSPSLEREVTPVARSIIAGQYPEQDRGFIIGSMAAHDLGVGIGDAVAVSTSDSDYELAITGIFRTGVEVLDRSIGFAPLATSENFIESRASMEVAYFCPAGTDLGEVKRSLERHADSAETSVMTWREKLPEVAQLVELNEFAMQIVTLLVVAILGFGVANVLLVSVMDRYRYYAILKAIGVRPVEVVVTVVGEALLMCLGAGIVGTFLGAAISIIGGQVGLDLGRYTSFNPHFSVNSIIHPRLTPTMTFGPQILALVAATLAALWPATVAARRAVTAGMRDL
ncbi:MAG: ABC transporter permease [Candidatus Hydrogenedentes bacterium]|nr:ABC transporter permease [Candidatus Hydrogenedentota bacterium]